MNIENHGNNIEIFVDLDCVLADFGGGVERIFMDVYGEIYEHDEDEYERNPEYRKRMWKACTTYQNNGGELWYELDLMNDAMELWEYILPYNPQILSATGPGRFAAADQKRRWVAKKFGDHVAVHLTEKARSKSAYAASHRVLIDDKWKAITPWVAAGGKGVIHTSARNSIRQLNDLGL